MSGPLYLQDGDGVIRAMSAARFHVSELRMHWTINEDDDGIAIWDEDHPAHQSFKCDQDGFFTLPNMRSENSPYM
jgi:hypothetical protein